MKRALKVLADREVSPQLGLLKSTLLQLDSTFSERNYGSSTFRDFVEKISKTGAVTIRQSGRNITVDLPEDGAAPQAVAVAAPARDPKSEPPAPAALDEARLAEIAQQVRQAIEQAPQPPRWPMYVRQFKQFLRANDQSLEEQGNGHGTVLDWIRACQRAGILRLERDRRGQMRVFPGAALQQPSGVVPPMFNPTQPPVDETLSGESSSDSGHIVDMIIPLPEEQIVVQAEEPTDQAPVVAKRVRNTATGTRKRAPRKRTPKK